LKQILFSDGSTFESVNYIMDSGYDYKKVYDYITHIIKAQPIIALNTRGAYDPAEGINEKFHPICSLRYPLTYWGKDRDYLKFRCPHVTFA